LEGGATLVTSNLPFDEWTSVFGSERLTGVLLERFTHHVHILEMNRESLGLATSKKAQCPPDQGLKASAKTPAEGDANTKILSQPSALQISRNVVRRASKRAAA